MSRRLAWMWAALVGVVLAAGVVVAGPLAAPGGLSVSYLATRFLPLTGGTMTGQQVFDGASGDILCDVASGSGEPLTFCPAASQYAAVESTAVSSTAETMLRYGVSDVTGHCLLHNATTGDARFTPSMACYNNQNASDFMTVQSIVNATYDSGTVPAMSFRSSRGIAENAGNAALVVRPTFQWQNFTTTQLDITATNVMRPLLYGAQSRCTDGAGAAACGAAPVGAFVLDAGATTVTVSTTAVGANSVIFPMENSAIGSRLGVTCNTTTGRDYTITTQTAGASFVVTSTAAPVTNPACLTYFIVDL